MGSAALTILTNVSWVVSVAVHLGKSGYIMLNKQTFWLSLSFGFSAFVAPAGVSAQTAPDTASTPGLPAFAFSRIKSGFPHVHFILGPAKKPGCPSLTPACQEKAYLVPGDVVITGLPFLPDWGKDDIEKGVVYAQYYSTTSSFSGYLPADALEPAIVSATPTAFVGHWIAFDNHSLIINGDLTVSGFTFNHPAPGSTPDENNISGSLDVQRGQAYYTDDGSNDAGCQIVMVRVQGFLIVQNNDSCLGGAAAPDFSGAYIHGDLPP